MLDHYQKSSQDTLPENRPSQDVLALKNLAQGNSGSNLDGQHTPSKLSNRSIRQKVVLQVAENNKIMRGDSVELLQTESDQIENDHQDNMTIQEAFTFIILEECRDSPLGTCLLREMQRFVEVLELYKPIAEFKINDIFRLSRFEEGLPKSIILQHEKMVQQRLLRESEQRMTAVSASMVKAQSVNQNSAHQSQNNPDFTAQAKDSGVRRITLPYASPSKANRRKPIKNSLLIALCKLNPSLSKAEQKKSYEEIVDELTCYIEKTIQLFWLNHKIGLFARHDSPQSMVFRLYRQAKDHFKLTMLKLKHRLKVSAFLLLQICPEEQLVEKVKGMNHHELLTLRVSLLEALHSSEYTINLDQSNVSSQVIQKVLANNSVATIDTGLRSSGEQGSQANQQLVQPGSTDSQKKKMLLDLDVSKVNIQNQLSPNNESYPSTPRINQDDQDEKDKTPQQVAQEMRKSLINMLQSNLVINGCQLTQRKQLGHVLHKYFSGYQSGISIQLLTEAIEFHYEGLDANSKENFKNGLTDLLSECGQTIHRDELFLNKPFDLNSHGFLASTQPSKLGQDAGTHSNHIATVQETLNGMSLAESDEYSDGNVGGQDMGATARTGSHDEAFSTSHRAQDAAANSPNKQGGSSAIRSITGSQRQAVGGMLQPGSGGTNPALARKVRTAQRTTQNKRKETQRQESIAEIFEKAKQAEQENRELQQGGDDLSMREVTNVANQANKDLKPIKFIGQYENVSKWIPRTCSVYAETLEDEKSGEHLSRSDLPENVAKMRQFATRKDLEKDQMKFLEAKKPTALFGEHSSGMHTSIDTMDVQMMLEMNKGNDGNEMLNAVDYKQTIQLQDLIMLTDMYSIPNLVTLFSRSQLNQKEIEYQVQSQIPHQEDFTLKRRISKKCEVSIVIPYNGATIGYVIAVLSCFGLCQLKFCKSSYKKKVVKIKLDGMVMSQYELLSIIHKIELIFHLAQFQEEYANFRPQFNSLDSQNNGGMASSRQGAEALELQKHLLSQRENMLLKLLLIKHKRLQKKLTIKKKTYETMPILQIQNYLSRDYHFQKWHLVEILEIQEREIASYGLKKQFCDIMNFMRQQQMDKSMELDPREQPITVNSVNNAISQMQVQRKTLSIKQETANRILSNSATGHKIDDYINQIRQKVNAIQPGDLTNQESTERIPREEPFRDEHSAALKASPGVQQLQRLVECIQLSQLQVKHIDFMNRLLKKKEKSTQLSLRCRNITQDELNAIKEQMEQEKDKLEVAKKQSQQRIDQLMNGDTDQSPSPDKKISKINVINQKLSTLAVSKGISTLKVTQLGIGLNRDGSNERGQSNLTNQLEVTDERHETVSVTNSEHTIAKERHPLLPELTRDEVILEEVSISTKLDALCSHKMNQCFLWHKQALISRLQHTESLLVCIDKRMYQQRVALVNLLKYVGGGIEIRENFIKKQLAQIAALEMQKSKDEDLLSEQTLKTIEIVNIADIAIEKKNLETQVQNLLKQSQELDITENQIQREKKRRDEKKAAREAAKKGSA